MNVPGGLQKYLMSLGPDAMELIKALGGAGKKVGKVGLEEGMGLASKFPKVAAGAGGGGLAALLSQLGGDGDDDDMGYYR